MNPNGAPEPEDDDDEDLDDGLLDHIRAIGGEVWVNETFEEMTKRVEFLDKVSCGTSELNAGIEVGWTPAKIRGLLADKGFREMVTFAQRLADGNIEKKLYQVARRGNMAAIQMWLFNREPDRWRDVKRIEVHHDATIQVGVIHSVKQGALALLGERSVADLQRLAIESTATEATTDDVTD